MVVASHRPSVPLHQGLAFTSLLALNAPKILSPVAAPFIQVKTHRPALQEAFWATPSTIPQCITLLCFLQSTQQCLKIPSLFVFLLFKLCSTTLPLPLECELYEDEIWVAGLLV